MLFEGLRTNNSLTELGFLGIYIYEDVNKQRYNNDAEYYYQETKSQTMEQE